MQRTFKISDLFFILCLTLFTVPTGSARPIDLDQYLPISGGEIDIPENSYVDGSLRHGGIQPDYWLNTQDPIFHSMRNFSQEIRDRIDLTFWSRVKAIETYLNQEVLDPTSYCDPVYLETLQKYRDAEPAQIDSMNIPLTEYVLKKRGVCREHAFFFHFLLKWAGIENRHLYVKIESNKNGQMTTENHAVITLEQAGQKWIVDSYFEEFNGFLYEDLTRDSGLTQASPKRRAPFARENLSYRKILYPLNYPIVWIPR